MKVSRKISRVIGVAAIFSMLLVPGMVLAGNGHGPGDGTGTGDGPKDGTGFGPGTGDCLGS